MINKKLDGLKILCLYIGLLALMACHHTDPSKTEVVKANDAFRIAVLPDLTLSKDTAVALTKILEQLDSKHVSFQEYIAHGHYELSDSVTRVVAQKIPDEKNQAAVDLHYKLLSSAIEDYNKRLGLNNVQARLAEFMFVSYDPIKTFCNDFRNSRPAEEEFTIKENSIKQKSSE